MSTATLDLVLIRHLALDLGRAHDHAHGLDRTFARARDHDLNRARDVDLDRARDVAAALNRDHLLAHAPHLALDYTLHLDRAHDRARAYGLALDLDLDLARDHARDLDRSLARAADRAHDRAHQLVSLLDIVNFDIDRNRALARDLKSLDALINDLIIAIAGRLADEGDRDKQIWRAAPPARPAQWLVTAAGRVAPVGQRARYVEEFRSELAELAAAGMSRRGQLSHAALVAGRSALLRSALLTPRRGPAAP